MTGVLGRSARFAGVDPGACRTCSNGSTDARLCRFGALDPFAEAADGAAGDPTGTSLLTLGVESTMLEALTGSGTKGDVPQRLEMVSIAPAVSGIVNANGQA
jgi:hypothetical protein